MTLHKQAGKSLGFSIAGGKGSTPAYEDVDEVCVCVCVYIINYMYIYVHVASFVVTLSSEYLHHQDFSRWIG